jgi:integrase
MTKEQAALERLKVKTRLQAHRRSGLPASLTTEELLVLYLERPHRWNAKTRYNYELAVRAHLAPLIGAIAANCLSVDDVAALIATLEARGCAPDSVRDYMKPLRQSLAWGMRLGIVERNPCDLLERHERPAPSRRRERILSTDELWRLFAVCQKEWMRCALVLAAFFGLRRNEILAVRRTDLNFEVGRLAIARQQGDAASAESREPKTRAGVRRIKPLYDDAFGAMDALARYLDTLLPDQAGLVCDGAGAPLKPRYVDAVFASVRDAAGLGGVSGIEAIVLHTLRHTYASMEARDPSTTLLGLQYQLGHSSLAATQRYAKYMEEDPFGPNPKRRLAEIVESCWKDGRQ